MAAVAYRDNPVSVLEAAQALDDVLAVVPERGRDRAMGRCAVCFLESMALHLGVGVCIDQCGLRVGVSEPFGEQGQGLPARTRVGTSGHLALAVVACWRMNLATLSSDIRVGR